MSNVLYQPLPTEWNGYEVNTWFQIGIQVSVLLDDEDIEQYAKMMILTKLLFGNEDDTLRDFPQSEPEFWNCVKWLLNGWDYDDYSSVEKDKPKEPFMDYTVDQGRIYADFRQIYGINLNEAEMHFWEFQWLLWNMPADRSSFLNAVKIRTMKPRPKATAEEKKAILQGKQIYGLKKKKREVYTSEQTQAIDDFDRRMEEIKARKKQNKEALEEFRK